MKIMINERKRILEIQKEFSEKFPYLKLEFFYKPDIKDGASPQKSECSLSMRLVDCRTIHNKETMIITSDMTVSDAEQNFRDVFGLSIKILRKSGKAWLTTTVTDGWSLEQQNNEGEALSLFV